MFELHVFLNVFKLNHIYNIDFVHYVKQLLVIYFVEILLVSIIFVNVVGKKFILVVWHHIKQWRVIQNLRNQSFIQFNNQCLIRLIVLLGQMDFKCVCMIIFLVVVVHVDEWLFMFSYLLFFFYIIFLSLNEEIFDRKQNSNWDCSMCEHSLFLSDDFSSLC